MSRIDVKIASPEGVAAGQTGTFKMPIGRRFHELQLKYSGVTLGQMPEIRIILNGKVVQRFSALFREQLNVFDGRVANVGLLVIPFDRYGLKLPKSEIETALNTGSVDEQGMGITSFSVEIDIDAAAVAPVMSMNATQSDALGGGAGTILYISKHTRDAAGAGEFEISDLPRGNSSSIALSRIAFVPSANSVDSLKVERNQYTIFDRVAELNTAIQIDGVRSPAAITGFVLDRSERGVGGDPIPMVGVSDYRYKLEMSGAASLVIYGEHFGRLSA